MAKNFRGPSQPKLSDSLKTILKLQKFSIQTGARIKKRKCGRKTTPHKNNKKKFRFNECKRHKT